MTHKQLQELLQMSDEDYFWLFNGPSESGEQTKEDILRKYVKLGIVKETNDYLKQVQKMFLCNGCVHEKDMPSHVKCHGCARMYSDNFEN